MGQLLSVGIIGGGAGGLEILKILSASSSCRIAFVVDRSPDAPALTEARRLGIEVALDFVRMIKTGAAQVIIEATGAAAVYDRIKEILPDDVELISGRMALLLFQIVEENRQKINARMTTEITAIKDRIISETGKTRELLDTINTIFRSMRILGFNAGVEAARAGEAGRGFAVVAQEVKDITDRTQDLSKRMDAINSEIAELSAGIDHTVEQFSRS